jgi:hypothetical protein
MSKTLKTGLTGSDKPEARKAVIVCFDAVTNSWHTLRTLAALLELCEAVSAADLEPEAIGEAAHLMSQELRRMRTSLQRLEKQVIP